MTTKELITELRTEARENAKNDHGAKMPAPRR